MNGQTRFLGEHTLLSIAACSLLMLAAPISAQPVPRSFQASPEVYRIVAESATHRMIEVTWAPGQRDALHSHSAAATYFITDCKLRYFAADGSSRDGDRAAGYATFQVPIPSHAVQNIGANACKLVMVEDLNP